MIRRGRYAAATVAGRVAAASSRVARKGGGTAIGGLVAQIICPGYVPRGLGQLSRLVLVSGTNGKTTTTALIVAALRASGTSVWTNHTGSNLERGLAAELMRRGTWHGGLPAACHTTGVFEVDERAFAALLPRVTPAVVVLLDIFRDQLDRYGDLDTTARAWRHVVANLPDQTIVVANADDPLVVSVAQAHSGRMIWFGTDGVGNAVSPDPWADVRNCPQCGERLIYDTLTFAHLGRYRCPTGDLVRPEPDVGILSANVFGVDRLEVALRSGEWTGGAALATPGLYSAYNCAAAIAVTGVLGIGPADALKAIAHSGPSFGRAEVIHTPEHELVILLTKNPSSANQVLDLLSAEPQALDTLILLNDGIADGEDVSWIWDVEFERLRAKRLTVGGIRAHDLSLRIKYSGVQPIDGDAVVELGISRPLDRAMERADGRLAVIATYTAMLALRDECVRRGWVDPFWDGGE